MALARPELARCPPNEARSRPSSAEVGLESPQIAPESNKTGSIWITHSARIRPNAARSTDIEPPAGAPPQGRAMQTHTFRCERSTLVGKHPVVRRNSAHRSPRGQTRQTMKAAQQQTWGTHVVSSRPSRGVRGHRCRSDQLGISNIRFWDRHIAPILNRALKAGDVGQTGSGSPKYASAQKAELAAPSLVQVEALLGCSGRTSRWPAKSGLCWTPSAKGELDPKVSCTPHAPERYPKLKSFKKVGPLTRGQVVVSVGGVLYRGTANGPDFPAEV